MFVIISLCDTNRMSIRYVCAVPSDPENDNYFFLYRCDVGCNEGSLNMNVVLCIMLLFRINFVVIRILNKMLWYLTSKSRSEALVLEVIANWLVWSWESVGITSLPVSSPLYKDRSVSRSLDWLFSGRIWLLLSSSLNHSASSSSEATSPLVHRSLVACINLNLKLKEETYSKALDGEWYLNSRSISIYLEWIRVTESSR